jgi:hypothetical protein
MRDGEGGGGGGRRWRGREEQVADDPTSRRGGPCGCAMQGGRGEWGGGALGFVGAAPLI